METKIQQPTMYSCSDALSCDDKESIYSLHISDISSVEDCSQGIFLGLIS